ncbi:MAG: 30S ribosomal protein S12 methylthiotransferase RimO [Nannocystis sp.]|uniref:30S ribosomal protein S12 methylthiotransferase RimO n=1 Tax=Nannocystis sp. TaxID=1962667 RepID=UPI002427017D|nr:30S ribosomal protein S12 methylthiotransferase RimO [Nannocystis sp.]MBK9756936.1 30S ribosomal protein S12 methylthiotransferase RimO [Nannocystis sp.]
MTATTPQNPSAKKVYFVSLGCPKNQVDTEIMLGVVRQQGHQLVDTAEEADTLVVNTCGFIEEAKQESVETILELAQAKAAGQGKRLVVAGCLSQRYPDELAKEMPEVDNFLGSADMLGLAQVLSGGAQRMGVTPLSRRAYLYDHNTPRQVSGRTHSAYVKIAEGCDRPCAFCIIPKLRGPQRSRSIASIAAEAEALVASGARELCLIAQDLTTYGSDLDDRPDLERLLDRLCQVPELRWIRLHYAFPTTVTDGLIRQIASEPKIATYIDVPLQHIDSEVLKRMRRGYTEKVVRGMVERLRAQSKYIYLRTTMLVGHPGESEAAFQRLYDFIEEGHVDHLGVFPWSREDGTPSALLPGRVDPELAEERRLALMELQEELRLARQEALIGEEIEVLVEGVSDESEFLLDGRHEGQAPGIDGKVILTDGSAEPGSFVRARVTQAEAVDLVASLEL